MNVGIGTGTVSNEETVYTIKRSVCSLLQIWKMRTLEFTILLLQSSVYISMYLSSIIYTLT